MFSECSEELKNKIKEEYKNIKEIALKDFKGFEFDTDSLEEAFYSSYPRFICSYYKDNIFPGIYDYPEDNDDDDDI